MQSFYMIVTMQDQSDFDTLEENMATRYQSLCACVGVGQPRSGAGGGGGARPSSAFNRLTRAHPAHDEKVLLDSNLQASPHRSRFVENIAQKAKSLEEKEEQISTVAIEIRQVQRSFITLHPMRCTFILSGDWEDRQV